MKTSGALLMLLMAVLGLAACTSQDAAVVKQAEFVQRPAAVVQHPVSVEQKPVTVEQKRQPQVSALRRKVLPLLEKKNYRQAVELMSGRYHEDLEKEYIQAINGLLEVGDDAFSLGDYERAAQTFKVVLNAYPAEPSLRERISHNPKKIRACMETCVDRMMEQGLEEYRRGRLKSAIIKWKVLLTISPGHEAAKKAIDTATIQLQALQNLKNK
jgi:tetratricopeptide (TPR) repeat protein